MLQLLKYIRGYLRIRVSGFSPERFMNLCSNKGILLWNIVRKGDAYEMNIGLKNYRALRPIVKKTGTRAAVLERYGLPFFLPKLLKRKMFAAGLLLAAVFWIWSSFFIWDIRVSGNYRITEDMLYTFLQEKQVTVGMKKSSLDIEKLEKEIRRQFSLVTWTSAKLEGTRLLIDIKENDAPFVAETAKETEGSSLVAEYEGTVVAMIVRSGVPMVSIGDTVEEGMLLVDGRVPVYNEDATLREYLYVDGDADIILEHSRRFRTELPFDYVWKRYTGREKCRHFLRVGTREWSLPEERPFLVYDSVIHESRPLLFQKLSIPIYWGSCRHREYQNVESLYTREQAAELLNREILTFLESLQEKGVQIIEKDVKIETDGQSWIVEGSFLVHEKAGMSTEIARAEEMSPEKEADE